MTLCSLCNYVAAHKVDGDSLIDNVKKEDTCFFIKEGFLDSQRVGNSRDYVYVTEIKEKRLIGYDMNGIYRIGVYQSHSPEFILIKQADKFKVYGSTNREIGPLLSAIAEYCEKNKIESTIELLYMREAIELYDNNNFKSPEVKKNRLSN
jgi:hypothetical protein